MNTETRKRYDEARERLMPDRGVTANEPIPQPDRLALRAFILAADAVRSELSLLSDVREGA